MPDTPAKRFKVAYGPPAVHFGCKWSTVWQVFDVELRQGTAIALCANADIAQHIAAALNGDIIPPTSNGT